MFAGVLLLALAIALAVGCLTPQLVAATTTPRGAFDASAVPRAPDYASDATWLALPSTRDEADVALQELPALDPAAAGADVFYVHPTTSIAPSWNAPFDDATIRAASVRGGMLIQASAFNGCCAVYAPTYRQASLNAFTAPSPDGDRAIDVAYSDVVAAYEEFTRRTGGERPFILAGHSQGAFLGARLLRERIATGEARGRLVAAYLIGAPLTADELGGLRACAAPTETGCVVTFNARGPRHERDGFDFVTNAPEEARLCVNPTLGAASAEPVPAARHGGAVFFDSARAALLPAFAASQCAGGRLVVRELAPLPQRDLMSGVLLWVMGGENYHPLEFQLFYADLRRDAARRLQAHGTASRLEAPDRGVDAEGRARVQSNS